MAFVAAAAADAALRSEQLPQAHERQHRAAQVRDAEQRRRTVRNARDRGDVNDLQDVLGRQRVQSAGEAKRQEAANRRRVDGRRGLIRHSRAAARPRARRFPRWQRPGPPLRATARPPRWRPRRDGYAGFLGRCGDLARAGRRLRGSRQDLGRAADDARVGGTHLGDLAAELLQYGRDGAAVLDFDLRGRRDLLEVALQHGDLLQHAARRILRALDVGGRFARKRADVVRDDREAAARLAGAGGFDRAADRQHARLHRDQRNGIDDLFDLPADSAEPRHGRHARLACPEGRR